MARLGICAACHVSNVGPSHWQSKTHRDKAYRAEHVPNAVGADEAADRARIMRAFRPDNGTAAENAAALRRLNGEPPAWADEAPLPEPWEDPEYKEPARVTRSTRLAPCPRCARSDFRTEKGRTWHLLNVPACKSYVKPDKHEYASL